MHSANQKLNSIKYKIIPSCNIIIEQYSGPISMEEIISTKQKISHDSSYSPNLNVIMDFEKADLIFESTKLKDYVHFANTFKKIYGKRKTAFLTSKPNEVVLTTLFGMQKGDLPVDTNTFSTLGAIAAWFGLSPEVHKIIDQELEHLKQQSDSDKVSST